MPIPALKPQKPTKTRRPIKPWEEPAEIARTAVEQVTRRSTPEEQLLKAQELRPPAEASPEEKRKTFRLSAFREELKEIKDLQKKRQEEMRARWRELQVVKKQREEEAKKVKGPLVEPVTKIKRGVFGAVGRARDIFKKQRQVEMVKTPTN